MKLEGRRDLGEGVDKAVEWTVNKSVARRVEFRVPGGPWWFSQPLLP